MGIHQRAGMTVLPARFTRVAPAGAVTCPARPTAVMRPLLTTMAALSTAGPPVPSTRRAPSKTVAAGVWPDRGAGQEVAATQAPSSRPTRKRWTGWKCRDCMAPNCKSSAADGTVPVTRCNRALGLVPRPVPAFAPIAGRIASTRDWRTPMTRASVTVLSRCCWPWPPAPRSRRPTPS